jgi:putative oxidoreductase
MKSLDRWVPQAHALLRIVTGLLLFEHGTSKVLHFPPVPAYVHLPLLSPIGILGTYELIAGALLTIGWFTRPLASIFAVLMAVLYLVFQAGISVFPSINMGQEPILYLFICLFLAAAGAGPWSVDSRRG